MEIPAGSSSVISSGSSPKGIGQTVVSAVSAGSRPVADSKHLVLQAFVHSVRKERDQETHAEPAANVSRDQAASTKSAPQNGASQTKSTAQPGNADRPNDTAATDTAAQRDSSSQKTGPAQQSGRAQQSSNAQQPPPSAPPSTPAPTGAVNAAIRAATTDTGSTTSGMSGTTGQYQVELLLNTNRNSPAVGRVDQLNALTLERLVQGQVLKLATQSPVPLVAGSTLTLALDADSAPRILGVNPPEGLSPLLRSVIGAALAHQDGPGPLLASLQRLLQQPALVSRLPTAMQSTMHQMLSQLPDVHGLRQTGALEKFIARSGLFWEGSLARILNADESQSTVPSDNSTAGDTAGNEAPAPQEDGGSAQSGEKPTGLFRASGLRQALDHLRQQILGATTDHETAATEPVTPKLRAPGQATLEHLQKAAATDFKASLLTLKHQLETAATVKLDSNSKVQSSLPLANQVRGGIQPWPTHGSLGESASRKPGAPETGAGELGNVEKGSVDQNAAQPSTSKSATNLHTDAAFIGKNTDGALTAKNELSIKNDQLVKNPLDAKNTPAAEKASLDKSSSAPSMASTSASTATTVAQASRYARAVDQYQRMAQITRPPTTPTGPAEASEPVSNEYQWDDVLATGIPVDMDIPGLGLPLPHKSKTRMEGDNDSLENLLGLLLRRTQETLNRLHLHQLSHAGATPRDTSTNQTASTLTFDLPVFFDGQIQVFNTRIDEEEIPAGSSESAGKKVKQWSVSLGFDIDGLGPMFCQLQMAEKQANLQFWADRPATLALTRQNLGFLSNCLNELGVSVTEVTCNEGMPKQTRTRLSQQLVDINT